MSRLSLGAEAPYKALGQKVQRSIPGGGIPFMKGEIDEIDVKAWEGDDDDEGESGNEMEKEEKEVGGDGGEREERRHLYIPPWR